MPTSTTLFRSSFLSCLRCYSKRRGASLPSAARLHSMADLKTVRHRWGNLPPELRAIKDRWLGESSEEIEPQPAVSDAVPSTFAAGSTPPRGDRQYKVVA